MCRDKRWHIQSCSALEGTGVEVSYNGWDGVSSACVIVLLMSIMIVQSIIIIAMYLYCLLDLCNNFYEL